MELHLHLICVFGVRKESFAFVMTRRFPNAARSACNQQRSGTASVCGTTLLIATCMSQLHTPHIQPSML
jgi:hypothetical protein